MMPAERPPRRDRGSEGDRAGGRGAVEGHEQRGEGALRAAEHRQQGGVRPAEATDARRAYHGAGRSSHASSSKMHVCAATDHY